MEPKGQGTHKTETGNNRKTDEGKKGRKLTGGHSVLWGRWREGDKQDRRRNQKIKYSDKRKEREQGIYPFTA